ncbi:MAG: NAD(+)/NADH kinase [Clostridia bacterium]
MKIAILSNVIKSNPTEAAHAFLDALQNSCELLIAKELESIIPATVYYDDEELFKKADIAVVLGGDGTTLTAARRAAPFNIPILSINTGHLGFLSTVTAKDAKKAAEALLKNTLVPSERMMLKTKVIRDDNEVFSAYALNDIIIRRLGGKLVNLSVKYNSDSAVDYRSDGVIISTPTGSTAYSLSCGGPVVLPTIDVFILSPICPHLLGHRPMVLPGDGVIEISIYPSHIEATISADGQEDFAIRAGDRIIIEKSPYKAKLLTLREQNFFHLVKEKLTLNS